MTTTLAVLTAANNADPLHPEQPPIGPDDLAPLTPMWQQAVNDELLPLVAEIYTTSAGTLHAGLVDISGLTQLPAISSLAAEEYLARARNTFDAIGPLLWEHARTQMLDGLQAGESIPQIAARVRAAAQLTAPQATMVARTQVLDALNAGSYTTARVSGLDLLKGWEATPDARTRPSHVVAGTVYQGVGMILLEDQFLVGGWPCARPHDPQLPGGERANCRCTLIYEMAPAPRTPGEVRDAQRAATAAHEQRLAELRRVFDAQRGALAAERDRRVAGAGADRDAGLRARAEHAARLAVLRREFEERRAELRAAYEARVARLRGLVAAADALVAHLPGKHDQSIHGRGGAGASQDGTKSPAQIHEQVRSGEAHYGLNTRYEAEPVGTEARNALVAHLPGKHDQSTHGRGSSRMHNDGTIRATFGYHDEATGLRSEVTEIDHAPDGKVYVRIGITDRDGERVGRATVTINPASQRTVRHDDIVLRRGIQGQGFAIRFNAQVEESYRAHGIEQITTLANVDVGGYAHARAGYGFADANARAGVISYMSSRQRAYPRAVQDALSRAARNPSVTPIELAMIGHTPGATMWPGKEMMLGSRWEAVKGL